MPRRNVVAVLCSALLLLSARPGQAQALNFFKNYIITGD